MDMHAHFLTAAWMLALQAGALLAAATVTYLRDHGVRRTVVIHANISLTPSPA